jgi:hypothetical protein
VEVHGEGKKCMILKGEGVQKRHGEQGRRRMLISLFTS